MAERRQQNQQPERLPLKIGDLIYLKIHSQAQKEEAHRNAVPYARDDGQSDYFLTCSEFPGTLLRAVRKQQLKDPAFTSVFKVLPSISTHYDRHADDIAHEQMKRMCGWPVRYGDQVLLQHVYWNNCISCSGEYPGSLAGSFRVDLSQNHSSTCELVPVKPTTDIGQTVFYGESFGLAFNILTELRFLNAVKLPVGTRNIVVFMTKGLCSAELFRDCDSARWLCFNTPVYLTLSEYALHFSQGRSRDSVVCVGTSEVRSMWVFEGSTRNHNPDPINGGKISDGAVVFIRNLATQKYLKKDLSVGTQLSSQDWFQITVAEHDRPSEGIGIDDYFQLQNSQDKFLQAMDSSLDGCRLREIMVLSHTREGIANFQVHVDLVEVYKRSCGRFQARCAPNTRMFTLSTVPNQLKRIASSIESVWSQQYYRDFKLNFYFLKVESFLKHLLRQLEDHTTSKTLKEAQDSLYHFENLSGCITLIKAIYNHILGDRSALLEEETLQNWKSAMKHMWKFLRKLTQNNEIVSQAALKSFRKFFLQTHDTSTELLRCFSSTLRNASLPCTPESQEVLRRAYNCLQGSSDWGKKAQFLKLLVSALCSKGRPLPDLVCAIQEDLKRYRPIKFSRRANHMYVCFEGHMEELATTKMDKFPATYKAERKFIMNYLELLHLLRDPRDCTQTQKMLEKVGLDVTTLQTTLTLSNLNPSFKVRFAQLLICSLVPDTRPPKPSTKRIEVHSTDSPVQGLRLCKSGVLCAWTKPLSSIEDIDILLKTTLRLIQTHGGSKHFEGVCGNVFKIVCRLVSHAAPNQGPRVAQLLKRTIRLLDSHIFHAITEKNLRSHSPSASGPIGNASYANAEETANHERYLKDHLVELSEHLEKLPYDVDLRALRMLHYFLDFEKGYWEIEKWVVSIQDDRELLSIFQGKSEIKDCITNLKRGGNELTMFRELRQITHVWIQQLDNCDESSNLPVLLRNFGVHKQLCKLWRYLILRFHSKFKEEVSQTLNSIIAFMYFFVHKDPLNCEAVKDCLHSDMFYRDSGFLPAVIQQITRFKHLSEKQISRFFNILLRRSLLRKKHHLLVHMLKWVPAILFSRSGVPVSKLQSCLARNLFLHKEDIMKQIEQPDYHAAVGFWLHLISCCCIQNRTIQFQCQQFLTVDFLLKLINDDYSGPELIDGAEMAFSSLWNKQENSSSANSTDHREIVVKGQRIFREFMRWDLDYNEFQHILSFYDIVPYIAPMRGSSNEIQSIKSSHDAASSIDEEATIIRAMVVHRYTEVFDKLTNHETKKVRLLRFIAHFTHCAVVSTDFAILFEFLTKFCDLSRSKAFISRAFQQAKIIPFTVRLIRDNVNRDIQLSAIRFLNRFLRQPSSKPQELVLQCLSAKKLYRKLFIYIKDTLRNITDEILNSQSVSSIHGRRRLAIAKALLKFLAHCCDNCNPDFQNFVRNQGQPTHNIDLVEVVHSMLGKLTQSPALDQHRNETVNLCRLAIDTLIEFTTGPCQGTQSTLLYNVQTYLIINSLLDAVVKNNTIVCLELFQSTANFTSVLVEHDPELPPNMLKFLNLSCIISHLKLIYSELENSDHPGKLLSIGVTLLGFVLKLRQSFRKCQELKNLSYRQPLHPIKRPYFFWRRQPTPQPSTVPEYIEFFQSNIQVIELQQKETIYTHYFLVPTYCNLRTKFLEETILHNLDYSSREQKLETIVRQIPLIKSVLKHQQHIQNCRLSQWTHCWEYYSYLTFFVSFITNILLLVYLTDDNGVEVGIDQPYRRRFVGCSLLIAIFTGLNLGGYYYKYGRIIVGSSPEDSNIQSPDDFQHHIPDTLDQSNRLPSSDRFNRRVQAERAGKNKLKFTTGFLIYNALYLLLAFTSVAYPFLYPVVLLLDVFSKFSVVRDLLRAITYYYKQLLVTVAVALACVQVFAGIGFAVFSDNFTATSPDIDLGLSDPDWATFCDSMLECFLSSLYMGLRLGGGIGDALAKPIEQNWNYYYRMVFDLAFFIVINIIVMNVIFGIILDTFGQLRDERNHQKKYIEDFCFICHQDREFYESHQIDFNDHSEQTHNRWAYIFFLCYLTEKDPRHCNGIEKYVKECLLKKSYEFFPTTSKILQSKNAADS